MSGLYPKTDKVLHVAGLLKGARRKLPKPRKVLDNHKKERYEAEIQKEEWKGTVVMSIPSPATVELGASPFA